MFRPLQLLMVGCKRSKLNLGVTACPLSRMRSGTRSPMRGQCTPISRRKRLESRSDSRNSTDCVISEEDLLTKT